ncbi:member of major facilitator superfamily multidrug-resistance, DHA1 sub-family [Gymnopilus junonius]|uniref:Member of major facilitator superfamily multidrug-resistance, DHA1 sub-family n=1 Tax=Gymnopilus junonius TaxID=109634 RepID=A0A9P5TMD9_GYMJU|nr:member of major facilitator superfamily multidrug-resistance, DHA1 sub-family [Gymnopilus junonius]
MPHLFVEGDTDLKAQRTPLPVGQLAILLLLRFCESSSTFVIFPFLNELLASVTGGDDAKVGYYSGLMELIRQSISLISVMYWSRLSDHIGRKPVLLLGTFALAISTVSLGLSKTFLSLVLSRCIFTALNSNAGVIKSMVGEITDHTNSADAFALLHVPWAAGSSFGAFAGGWLARPHDHFSERFADPFWVTYPYLLPCAVTAAIATFACLVILAFLRETIQADGSMEPLLGSHTTPNTQDIKDEPVPLKSLLHKKTLIPIFNYVCIASLHYAYNAIQPLFLAMPVTIGGLGLAPREVGFILGTYGIANSIFQTVMLGRLVRRFGVKAVFMAAVTAFIPIFTFSPLMNLLVSEEGFSYIVWIMLAFQLSCALVMELGYGCVYMFITAAAPNKRSLGATNGLAQTLVSIGRMVMP